MLYLVIMLIFALFAGVAMTINEGTWSNAVSLLCIVAGGLIAVPWGLTFGDYVVAQAEPAAENVWAFIFASVWGVYVLSVTVLRVAADKISRVRMKFIPPVEMAGGPLIGLFVAVMYVSFAASTLLIPVSHGQFKPEEMADWANSTYRQMLSPFNTVCNAFYADELELVQVFDNK